MKQSEMKAQIDTDRKAMAAIAAAPQLYTTIKCKHKIYATSGCVLCWHCPKCGARGCDNLYMMKSRDKHVSVDCDLEDG